jgi:hypothetical protein
MGASWCMQPPHPGQEMHARPAQVGSQRVQQYDTDQYRPLSHPPPAPPAQQSPAQSSLQTHWRCEENEKMRAIGDELARQANENIRVGIKKESAIATACTIFDTVFGTYMDSTTPQYPYPPEIRDQFIRMGRELINAAVDREEVAVKTREDAQRATELQQQQQVAAQQYPTSPFGLGHGRSPLSPPIPSQQKPAPTSDQPSAAPGGSVRGSTANFSTLQPHGLAASVASLQFGSAPPTSTPETSALPPSADPFATPSVTVKPW